MVEKACFNDAEEILSLINTSNREAYRNTIPQEHFKEPILSLQDLLEDFGRKTFCVCRSEGRIVGVAANLVTANAVVLALARTGHADDPSVGRAYAWLCSWQQEDGSWLSPRAWKSREEGKGHPYPYCGLHATCNVLLGLGATEQGRRSEAAKRGASFLLSLCGHICPLFLSTGIRR